MLAENDEDVKTVQSHMRHANSNITMNNYTHAVSSKKRRAQIRGGGNWRSLNVVYLATFLEDA